MSKGKAADYGGVTVEEMDDEEFDVDNMDFALPLHLLAKPGSSSPSSSSQQPLLMTQEEATQYQMQAMAAQNQGMGGSPMQEGRVGPTMAMDPQLKAMISKWICIYPLYLDANRSSAHGRKLPKTLAIQNPSIIYLGECCRKLGLSAVIEQTKRHPADPLTFGRMKVQLKGPTGAPIKANIRNKFQLLVKIASVYAEVEEEMNKGDPRMVAAAAASRSEVSKVVEESLKEATKEIKQKEDESGGGKSSKKGKKK